MPTDAALGHSLTDPLLTLDTEAVGRVYMPVLAEIMRLGERCGTL